MDSVFGSPQLNRRVWSINRRKNINQEFMSATPQGYKSNAQPSVVTWRGPGKGVQGESVNYSTNSGKTQLNKNRKAT